MHTATFLATHPRAVSAAQIDELAELCQAHPHYDVSRGEPARGRL